jgi:hypothetical protein
MIKIDNYVLFKRDYVDIDLQEFMEDRSNLRKAWHSATSLFHLSDWVYHAHKVIINARYTFTDRNNNVKPVREVSQFANALGQQFSDFQLIRGIANASKHLKLDRSPPGRRDPPEMPSNAANTYTSVGFSNDFDASFYKGEVMLQAQPKDIPFAALVQSVSDTWVAVFAREGW